MSRGILSLSWLQFHMTVMSWKCSLLSADEVGTLQDWVDTQWAPNDHPWAVKADVYGSDLVAENWHIQRLMFIIYLCKSITNLHSTVTLTNFRWRFRWPLMKLNDTLASKLSSWLVARNHQKMVKSPPCWRTWWGRRPKCIDVINNYYILKQILPQSHDRVTWLAETEHQQLQGTGDGTIGKDHSNQEHGEGVGPIEDLLLSQFTQGLCWVNELVEELVERIQVGELSD